jgi:hypothetical protein
MDKFNWTDELVKDFVRTIFNRDPHNYLPYEIEAFKKSKQSKPKDYEILSFKSVYSGVDNVILTKHGSEFHPNILPTESYSLEYLLKQPTAKIHSVRRLSDGEVFTVGDKITWGIPEDLFVTKINGFKIVNGRLEIDHDSFVKNISVDFEEAYKLKKVKEPLFTTDQEHYIKLLIKRALNEISISSLKKF